MDAMKASSRLLPALLALLPLGAAGPQRETGTPVVIAAEEECQIAVDGEDQGTIPAGGTKKIRTTPGEHLVTAVCAGARKWRQVITVGDQQKVVNIQGPAAPAAAPAAGPAVVEKGYTGIAYVITDNEGRWKIVAVVKDSAAYRANLRAGSVLVSVAGERAKNKTFEDLVKLDEGPLGSAVEAEILDKDDQFRKVTIHRAAIPQAGILEVLNKDGTVREAAYNAGNMSQVAAGAFAPSNPVATTGLPQFPALLCLKCLKKPMYGGSSYCIDHKCAKPTCLDLEAVGGNYCLAHKCTEAFCQNEKAPGNMKCWMHIKW